MIAPGATALADYVNEVCDPAGAVSPSVRVRREVWGRYLLALMLYVALAVGSLSLRDNVVLLNWMIGPLFPVVVLYVVPTGLRLLAGRLRSR